MPEVANSDVAETKPDEVVPAAPVKQMKCIVLAGFGGLKMVKMQQKPEITANEGEVLIRVKAW